MKLNSRQKKLIWLLSGFLLILFLSWSMSVKKTWNSYNELKEITASLDNMDISELMVRDLEQQLAQTKLIQSGETDSVSSKLIFKKITDVIDRTGKIRVIQFPEVHRYPVNNYQLETMKIELEGDFPDLLRLIYHLEKEHSIGEMASAGFKLVKDLKLNREYLRLTVFIQNLQKQPNL